MNCLKLQPGTLKQCLVKDADEQGNHPGECVFTLLKPEVAAAMDKRKERDNQLTRRNLADGYLKSMIGTFRDDVTREELVDEALAVADLLISKTGGHGP